MLTTDLIRQNAALYPDEEALIALDASALAPFDDAAYDANRRSYTWAEMDRIADQVASYYNSIGIGPGSKVAILLKNCLEFLPLYFGVLRSGAAAVPLNFRYHEDDVVHSCHFAGVSALVFGSHCRATVENCRPRMEDIRSFIYIGGAAACPAFASLWEDTCLAAPAARPAVTLTPDMTAAIYFSSGTTGAPKAVIYSHGTLEAARQVEHSNHHQVHEDCFVLIPPLYHVGGKLHWMGNLPVGARCVMLLGFRVDAFFEVMRREHVTISFLLLPWVQDILARLDSGTLPLDKYDTSSWRLLHMGAQHIPPSIIHRMQAYFPDMDYEVSYGLTESGGPGCLNLPCTRLDKLGSVGLPAAGWEAKIVDRSGEPVPAGRPGELLLRGPGVMKGYYRAPELTSQTVTDGWLHTGDLARQDEDGFYYIVGRIKDIIISGGENVYPVPIEEYLRTHPAVQDAAVFGICDKRLGEAVAAQVELTEGASCTEEEMLAYCEKLPRFQRPRRVFIGPVPRNPTGKIDKKALRCQHSPADLFPEKSGT